MYNNIENIVSPYPYLKIRFEQNAKRNTKITSFLRRIHLNSLWWNVPNSTLLQKTENQRTFVFQCKISNSIHKISSGRTYNDYNLRHNCWYTSFNWNKDTTIQWLISENIGIKNISSFIKIKPFHHQFGSQDITSNKQNTQSPIIENVQSSPFQNQRNIRFRLNSFNSIWETARIQDWLQSSQEGSPFLSTLAMFRSTYSGLLAWGISFWRYPCKHWSSSISARVFCQDTTWNIQDTGSWRCRVLRPLHYRVSRRQTGRVCCCSQNYEAYTIHYSGVTLPQVQRGPRDSRVSVSTTWLEESSSLYSREETPARRRSKLTTNPFCVKEICLQGYGNQPQHQTGICLVFLQWTLPCRTDYQRTKGRLSLRENPFKILECKQGIFSPTSVCLQYSQLVQETMFTQRTSTFYFTNYSHRISGSTGKIGENRQQELTETTQELCLSKSIFICNKTNSENEINKNASLC